jgi:uncharacterized membrane protein
VSYWPLLGVALVVLGFVFRLNPLLVVVAAGVATGLLAGIGPRELLALIGAGFLKSRFLLLLVLTLPVIGLCERSGLRARAAVLIGRLRGATAGRLLIAYLAVRQFAAMLGLTAIAGHPQTVRPLLAPMVEAAAERDQGLEPERKRETLRAYAAATDNVGLFFGEDVFLAFGAVLLIQGFLAQSGYALDPVQIALWGLPTAIAAFGIHAWRLTRLDARLRRPPDTAPPPVAPTTLEH